MKDSIQRRVTWIMVLCLGCGAALLARAGYLQLASQTRLDQLARKQFYSKVLVRPRRGEIRDRNGEPLAVSMEVSSLAANPSKVKNKRNLSAILSKATDIPSTKIYQKLTEKREFVWIKRHISDDELEKFKKQRIIDADGDLAAGLWLIKESRRVYPHGELASQTLGSVNIDSEGLEGTELWQNDRLRGKIVSLTAVKDALGRPTFIDAVAAKDLQDGEPIQLTLDASLQFTVEQELKKAVQKSNARAGTVIVMNAVTGEILAMASNPTYNSNEKSSSADRKRNRGITDGYEPGSTLKAVLLAGALSQGWKLTDQVWGHRGKLQIQGKWISEAEAHEKFEWLSLKKLIQVSSNVGAAKLALKLGSDRYFNVLKNFEFGTRTGVGFPGEIAGRLPARKTWQPLTLANIGFGQGILVTPIQMIRAYAAFANGGWLVQPTLLKNPEAGAVQSPPRRVLSQKMSDQVVEALESVTEEGGTGLKANLPGYRVAGKTGTAQEVDPGTGAYSRSRYVASFIGFAVGVEPKIVIYTAIDGPKGVYYASETAAPLFKEVLAAVSNRFSMPPQIEQKRRELAAAPTPSPFLKGGIEKDKIFLQQSHPTLQWAGTDPSGALTWNMPSFKGVTPREAIQVLQGHRFQLEVRGVGVVQHQSPEAGKPLSEGGSIHLQLGEP